MGIVRDWYEKATPISLENGRLIGTEHRINSVYNVIPIKERPFNREYVIAEIIGEHLIFRWFAGGAWNIYHKQTKSLVDWGVNTDYEFDLDFRPVVGFYTPTGADVYKLVIPSRDPNHFYVSHNTYEEPTHDLYLNDKANKEVSEIPYNAKKCSLRIYNYDIRGGFEYVPRKYD